MAMWTDKQEAHRSEQSPEYQRLYTDFLSEVLIFECRPIIKKVKFNNGGRKQHYNLLIQ